MPAARPSWFALSLAGSLAAVGCSAEGARSADEPCTPSGTFTETVTETTSPYCDGGYEPASFAVAVDWTVDGGVTVNGQTCTASCLLDGGSEPCAEAGLPVNSAVSGVCEVFATCTTGSITAIGFYTNVGTHSIDYVRHGPCDYQVRQP